MLSYYTFVSVKNLDGILYALCYLFFRYVSLPSVIIRVDVHLPPTPFSRSNFLDDTLHILLSKHIQVVLILSRGLGPNRYHSAQAVWHELL